MDETVLGSYENCESVETTCLFQRAETPLNDILSTFSRLWSNWKNYDKNKLINFSIWDTHEGMC